MIPKATQFVALNLPTYIRDNMLTKLVDTVSIWAKRKKEQGQA